ncbi:MAG TPA: 4a-hydroxytetrahydrobiopterin dehydratase [Thermoanaerobaculia bacterium]|nr:4a-hydroxytetrahydrobiopterin dehydratase [Thermoanaerobaculia bacterium]
MMEKPVVDPSMPVRMDLKPERVQQALLMLPSWRLRQDGVAIESERVFVTGTRATSFAGLACRLANKLGQPVRIDVTGLKVLVTLTGHPVRGCVGGLTNPVFKLADLIGS